MGARVGVEASGDATDGAGVKPVEVAGGTTVEVAAFWGNTPRITKTRPTTNIANAATLKLIRKILCLRDSPLSQPVRRDLDGVYGGGVYGGGSP